MLNRLFLAVIIALLVTAVSEAIFLFVYKEPQRVEENKIVNVTPAPTPELSKLAVNPGQIKLLESWPRFRNSSLNLTVTTIGTISAVDQLKTAEGNGFDIVLSGEQGLDLTHIVIAPKNLSSTTVYILDSKTKLTTPASISDLKPGEIIHVITSNDLGIDPNAQNSPEQININIIK